MVEAWRNRIVGTGEVAPAEIEPHLLNWRRHPTDQRRALLGALGEVGWVQPVVVNRRTGRLVDGHLRVELALQEGAETVPVVYVDLDEREERLALASLDAIAALALTDDSALSELLDGIEAEDADLATFLDGLDPPSEDEDYLSAPLVPDASASRPEAPAPTSARQLLLGVTEDEHATIVAAISRAEGEGYATPGSALAAICRQYLYDETG